MNGQITGPHTHELFSYICIFTYIFIFGGHSVQRNRSKSLYIYIYLYTLCPPKMDTCTLIFACTSAQPINHLPLQAEGKEEKMYHQFGRPCTIQCRTGGKPASQLSQLYLLICWLKRLDHSSGQGYQNTLGALYQNTHNPQKFLYLQRPEQPPTSPAPFFGNSHHGGTR